MIELGFISKEDKKKHESNVVYSVGGGIAYRMRWMWCEVLDKRSCKEK